jgi:hypothetical protein
MPNGTYGGVRGKETSRKENYRFLTYSIAQSSSDFSTIIDDTSIKLCPYKIMFLYAQKQKFVRTLFKICTYEFLALRSCCLTFF